MRFVILNGDDFGLAPAINDGIVAGHVHGCLTSASLSVVGPAAEAAARAAMRHPDLGIGLHLTLVDERPACDPRRIPSLVNADGRFRRTGMELARAWLGGRIRTAEIEAEIVAQLQRAEALGLTLTHVDSHDHVHVLPGLFERILTLLSRAGVRCIRIPRELDPVGDAGWQRRLSGLALNLLARRAGRLARERGFSCTDAFSGFRGAGRIDAESLLRRLRLARHGVTEIALHPAVGSAAPRPDFASWCYGWEAELKALLDPRVAAALDDASLAPISYAQLPSRARNAAEAESAAPRQLPTTVSAENSGSSRAA